MRERILTLLLAALVAVALIPSAKATVMRYTLSTDVTNCSISIESIEDLETNEDGTYFVYPDYHTTISFTVNPDDNYLIADSYPAEGDESSTSLPNPHVKVYNGDEVSIITPRYENGSYLFDMPNYNACICVYCEEAQTPSDGTTRSIIPAVTNGTVSITSDNASQEESIYNVLEGETVTFQLIPNDDSYTLATGCSVYNDSLELIQYSDNPVIVTRDSFAHVEFSFDAATGVYSFIMPEENVLIVAKFIESENPPVNEEDSLVFALPDTGVFEVYLLTPNESGEGYVSTLLTPDEYGYVYVHAGDLISFSVAAPEGSSIPSEAYVLNNDGTTATINNPCLFQFDEEFMPVYLSDALAYDEESGTYSFIMPDENTYLFVEFLSSENDTVFLGIPTDENIEYVISLLTPDESGDGYIATQLTPDEYGFIEVNAGDLISVSATAPEGLTLDSNVRYWINDNLTLEFPNPCLLSFEYDEDDNLVPYESAEVSYDSGLDSYIFTMPAENASLLMVFTGYEEDDFIIGLSYGGVAEYVVSVLTPNETGDGYIATKVTPDENYWCHVNEGDLISVSAIVPDGYVLDSEVRYLVGDKTYTFPNPSVLSRAEDIPTEAATLVYDKETDSYIFTMPGESVYLYMDYISGNQGTTDPDDEKLFIGRNPGEGGTIEFIDNESWSADEGDKVSFKVIPDKGYAIDEVKIVKARYIEDGSIETIDGEYLDSLQKNEDGSYTFTMPGSPVQIIATFKPLYNPDSTKLSYTKGSKKSVVITIKRSVDDPSCYTHFAGKVTIGGKELKRGENYTDASGSTVITLVPDYLETLANGDQDVVITFDDGEVTLPLSIAAAAATTDGNTTNNSTAPTASESPATGDTGNLTLWIALMALAGAGMLGTTVLRKKNECANR